MARITAGDAVGNLRTAKRTFQAAPWRGLDLFNSFGDILFVRYGEIRSIRPSFFEVHRGLYNLYPLLVHLYFFSGDYLGSVRSTLRRFGL